MTSWRRWGAPTASGLLEAAPTAASRCSSPTARWPHAPRCASCTNAATTCRCRPPARGGTTRSRSPALVPVAPGSHARVDRRAGLAPTAPAVAITCVPRLVASLIADGAAPPIGRRRLGRHADRAAGRPRRADASATAFTGATVTAVEDGGVGDDCRRRPCSSGSRSRSSSHALSDDHRRRVRRVADSSRSSSRRTSRITSKRTSTRTSDHFIHVLESICQTHLEHGNRVDVFTNGDTFYPAMLDAIRHARETINMEAYIFKPGVIGDQFIEALCERAKAGVRVTLVVDAIGIVRDVSQVQSALRGGRRPHRRLPALHVVPAGPAEQPHPPRAAHRRRRRRVRRRRRRRRLVGPGRSTASRCGAT